MGYFSWKCLFQMCQFFVKTYLFIHSFNNSEYILDFHVHRCFLMTHFTCKTRLSQGISSQGNSEHLIMVQEDIPCVLAGGLLSRNCVLIRYRRQWAESPRLLQSRMLTTECQPTSVMNPLATGKLISLTPLLKWCMFHASLFIVLAVKSSWSDSKQFNI